MYIFSVLLISALFILTMHFRHKQISFIIFAVIGLLLLCFSSLFYSFRMSGIYDSGIFTSFRFVYKVAAYLKLSFADIYRMSLIGSMMVYLSTLSLSFNMLPSGKTLFASLALMPLYIYLYINDPDISFSLYIKNSLAQEGINSILSFTGVYNLALVFIYFIIPLTIVLIYYKNTDFIIKKRHAIFMLIYIVTYYMLIFVMNTSGLIHFLQGSSVEIIKYHGGSLPDITLSTVLIFVCIILIMIIILTVKTSKMQNYSTASVIKNTNMLDKNLRMILHTYKNRFFAINQQIAYLKSLNEPYSEKAVEVLDFLDDFSGSALTEISERINSLQNIKIMYMPIDLIKCVDSAIEKVYIPEEIHIIKEYKCREAIIFSESKCMTEMVFNLIQNSIEAFSMKPDEPEPVIKIKIVSETDWILLEIEDNGCGISTEEKKHIFTPLYSAKQGKNNFGIGLHYVKKIVSAHHGYIFVESEPGSFAKFQVYLPSTPHREEKDSWSNLKLKL